MNLKELGKEIRKRRELMGISQEKFALKIGMDRTYYSAVENGKHNITILSLAKITDGLEITLSELFKGMSK